MLAEHLQAKAFIAPPQIYELSRLANFRQYDELKSFAIYREQFGIERWTYYVNGLQDGALLALPGTTNICHFFSAPLQSNPVHFNLLQFPIMISGDDKFPLDGNLEQQSNDSIGTSLVEMRALSTNLNRIELQVPIGIAYCNVPMPCGHVPPITFDQIRAAKL